MIEDYISINEFVDFHNLDNIITNDFDAWEIYKKYNFIYNKLWIAQSQNLNCGPMGVDPKNFPVIFKPIINLYGMSRNFYKINNLKEYYNKLKDGLFWMDFLEGDFYCIDFILFNGKIVFYSCLQSFPNDNIDGTFKYHKSIPNYKLPENIKNWIEKYMIDYSGCFNIEMINNKIIEAHLRLNGDFYLYNLEFMKNVDKLYKKNEWNFKYKIKKIYLFPIFVKKNFDMTTINIHKILEILIKYKAKTLRIDNVKSMHQGNSLSRLFMFDINSKINGEKIVKQISKILKKN